MRKSVLLMILLFAVGMTASAQKFALICMSINILKIFFHNFINTFIFII